MNTEPSDTHASPPDLATPPPLAPPAQVAPGSTVPAGLAPVSSRAIAVLIDWVIIIVAVSVLARILPFFASTLIWLFALAYIIARDSLPFLDGQSIGKKLMKIRVVTQDGRPITNNWEAALRRNAALAIPIFGLVELIILLTRETKPERGQRLGDEWAGTKVITCDPAAPQV
jgi:uncharacterized RDD family membrane protein YckC